MKRLFDSLSALTASLLIALLLLPAEAFAKTRPLTADVVHTRIVRRGIDNWVCVEQSNGVQLVGRIIAINPDSFTMQLPDDPQPVTIFYTRVIGLQTGASRGFWIFTGSAIAASAAFTIWAAVHFHNVEQQHQLPPAPTFP